MLFVRSVSPAFAEHDFIFVCFCRVFCVRVCARVTTNSTTHRPTAQKGNNNHADTPISRSRQHFRINRSGRTTAKTNDKKNFNLEPNQINARRAKQLAEHLEDCVSVCAFFSSFPIFENILVSRNLAHLHWRCQNRPMNFYYLIHWRDILANFAN